LYWPRRSITGTSRASSKGFIDRTFSYLTPDYRTNPQPSRLAPKKLVFVLTQGQPDEDAFADIFPRYEGLLKWMGFSETKLLRACGIGPGNIDAPPAAILRQAEETARDMLA